MKHTVSGDITAGGAIFTRLKALGVDYVSSPIRARTFPPIIEGLAEAAAKNIDLPQALVIPHEHAAALGMAHGYYLMTGKAQAVMLHTNVGLSNGATGAINARLRERAHAADVRPHAGHRGRPFSAPAPCRSAGARKCATRRHWCANPASGITN